MEPVFADARTLTAPEALRGYHAASLQATQMLVDFVADQPADEIMNPFDLLGVGLMAKGLTTAARDKLPEALRAQLDGAGCL